MSSSGPKREPSSLFLYFSLFFYATAPGVYTAEVRELQVEQRRQFGNGALGEKKLKHPKNQNRNKDEKCTGAGEPSSHRSLCLVLALLTAFRAQKYFLSLTARLSFLFFFVLDSQKTRTRGSNRLSQSFQSVGELCEEFLISDSGKTRARWHASQYA